MTQPEFTPQEEQVLGRLFVEHVRQVVPNVTFFDVFKHLASLAPEASAPVQQDDFDGIVAGVVSPAVMSFDDGLNYITDYMSHGGKVAHVEEWLGVPIDNALDVLAFGIDAEETEDQDTMLSWGETEWSDIEATLKSTRDDERWDHVRIACHLSDRHNISVDTAQTILGWYGR